VQATGANRGREGKPRVLPKAALSAQH